MPLLIAAPTPRFPLVRITVAPAPSACAAVSSVDPSSTTTVVSTSLVGTACTTRAMRSPSFHAGATQSTRGRATEDRAGLTTGVANSCSRSIIFWRLGGTLRVRETGLGVLAHNRRKLTNYVVSINHS